MQFRLLACVSLITQAGSELGFSTRISSTQLMVPTSSLKRNLVLLVEAQIVMREQK